MQGLFVKKATKSALVQISTEETLRVSGQATPGSALCNLRQAGTDMGTLTTPRAAMAWVCWGPDA